MAPVQRGVTRQPVDVEEVAARPTGPARGAPADRVPDMGGPAVPTLADAVRALMRVSGRRRPVLRVPLPGKVGPAAHGGDCSAPATPLAGAASRSSWPRLRRPTAGRGRRSGRGDPSAQLRSACPRGRTGGPEQWVSFRTDD